MVGADHERWGDRGAVGAGGEVGGVALPPGQRPRLGLQGPVHRLVGANEFDEPVAFDRHLPGDGLLGLADLLVDAVQGAPRPVGRVLVVDDLVPTVVARACGPGLGHDQAVGYRLTGVLAPPLGDDVGDVEVPRAEDERQSCSLDRLLIARGEHPCVRDDGDVDELVGGA